MSDVTDQEADPVEIALRTSEAVFDITSLRSLNEGYNVRTKQWQFKDFIHMIFKSIFVCIIGDFKVGKTFITGKLMDLSTAPDQVLHTPGICVTTSKSTRPKKIPAPTTNIRRGFRAKVIVEQVKKDEPIVHEFDFVTFDTAGTEVPAHMDDLKDVKATEVLLRMIILLLSQKVVYVTQKFDRPAQDKMQNVFKQLEKLNKPVSTSNRVAIIHNLWDVVDEETLYQKIEKVAECYKPRESESSDFWLEKNFNDISIYDTKYATHYFLVKDEPTNEFDGSGVFDGKEYNSRVIKTLKSRLYETDPIIIPLFQKLLRHMSDQLHFFLMDWEPSYSLLPVIVEDDELSGGVVPAVLKEGKEENGDGDVMNETSEKLSYDEQIKALEGLDKNEPFLLNRMKFVDTGVQSESVVELQGTWWVNEEKSLITLYIRGVSGFKKELCNKNNLRINFNRTDNFIEVSVRLSKPEIPTGFEQGNPSPIINDARGVFTCPFPEDVRFLIPKIAPEFYEENIIVRDGTIEITVEKEGGFE